jgi:hypothetical protein
MYLNLPKLGSLLLLAKKSHIDQIVLQVKPFFNPLLACEMFPYRAGVTGVIYYPGLGKIMKP